LQADFTRVAVLLATALFWAVALGHALPSKVTDVRLDGAVHDALPGHAGVSSGAIAIVAALARMRLGQDSALDLEVSERRHAD
jgi:hypothetical protein